MLSFFRNYSLKIMAVIIISFAVTTFLGAIFFNQSFDQSSNKSVNRSELENSIALIGTDIPVTKSTYGLQLNRITQSLPKDIKLNTQLNEMIQIRALSQAIENTLLLKHANEINIKTTRADINDALNMVMTQFDVSNKKELKTKLISLNQSYDDVVYQIKNDVKVQKLKYGIFQSVALSDTDKAHQLDQYDYNIILLSKLTSQNVEIDDEELFNQATSIRSMIRDTDSFNEQKNIISNSVGGPFYKQSLHQISPVIARTLYQLNPKEISQPIKSYSGYYIVELLNKGDLLPSAAVTEAELLENWQQIAYYEQLAIVKGNRDVKIIDPYLSAIKFKNEGNYDGAIESYQKLMSQNPSNPMPNFFIAQIHILKNDIAKAKQELLKAEIKESLISDKVVVPEIHFVLAQIYELEQLDLNRDKQYDKLINSDLDVSALEYLKTLFEKSNDTVRLNKVTNLINQINTKNDIKSGSEMMSTVLDEQLNEPITDF